MQASLKYKLYCGKRKSYGAMAQSSTKYPARMVIMIITWLIQWINLHNYTSWGMNRSSRLF